jgi:L-lactate permease
LRVTAWIAVIIGLAVTILLGWTVWSTPFTNAMGSYGLGAATGVWPVDRIVLGRGHLQHADTDRRVR